MTGELRAINALERRIVRAEDDADAMLWEQARLVVEQLAGLTQRELARQWFNVRGEAYSQMHVSLVKSTFEKHAFQIPRPRFRDAYEAIAHPKRKPEPKDPVPFHWLNASEDLYQACRAQLMTWPEEARPLIGELLREVAARFERDNDDVGRGTRKRTTGARADFPAAVDDSTAA